VPLVVDSFYENQPETIVLIHGGGLSGRQWGPQVEGLTDNHLLIPDLPEQGRTPGPFNLQKATSQVAELVQARTHGGQAHFVGLSLGGAVVLELMRIAPRLMRTALVTGTSGTLAPWLGKIMKWSAGASGLLSAKWLANAAIAQHHIAPRYRDLVYDDLVRAVDPGFNTRVADALVSLRLPSQTATPFLALVGENETYFAKAAQRKIVASIQGAKGAIVPAVGHVWNLEQPELFCDVVRSWVKRNELHPSLRPEL